MAVLMAYGQLQHVRSLGQLSGSGAGMFELIGGPDVVMMKGQDVQLCWPF